MQYAESSFSAHAWAKEILNKQALDSPMSVSASVEMAKDFSVQTWFHNLFGTVLTESAEETLIDSVKID